MKIIRLKDIPSLKQDTDYDKYFRLIKSNKRFLVLCDKEYGVNPHEENVLDYRSGQLIEPHSGFCTDMFIVLGEVSRDATSSEFLHRGYELVSLTWK